MIKLGHSQPLRQAPSAQPAQYCQPVQLYQQGQLAQPTANCQPVQLCIPVQSYQPVQGTNQQVNLQQQNHSQQQQNYYQQQQVQQNVSQADCECGSTRRQYFNFLRNNSSDMRGVLSWVQFQQPSQKPRQNAINQTYHANANQKAVDQSNRHVTFDTNQQAASVKSPAKAVPQARPAIATQNASSSRVNRSASVNHSQNRSNSNNKRSRNDKNSSVNAKIRKEIRQRELEAEAEKKEENRQRVQQYIQELKPYTRSLTNTKYQDYFGKAALESYGRANTRNAIGGIIYGNHQKTFNLNPHIRGNEPAHYQTHTTAINYGKRTKLNEESKWRRLQKELAVKLGLKDKNETLKQGKEVVYVDVDESNMYSVMRQNLQFKKEHDAEIRQCQKDYKDDIEQEKKQAVEEFYQAKQARTASGNTIDSQLGNYQCTRDKQGRLQEQVIYRTTDKEGNVRLGADRHALTCFVDLNFPENQAAYTYELKNRLPIYPLQVQEKDKYIDEKRRENYQQSLQSIYPSHYLVPNCDQPQLIKMYSQGQPTQVGEPRQSLGKKLDQTRSTQAGQRSLVGH